MISNSTIPPIKEDKEYFFDILHDISTDGDPLLLEIPLCGTIVSKLWEEASDIIFIWSPMLIEWLVFMW
jgi:hypothetical protein